jgi:hypothetical protein
VSERVSECHRAGCVADPSTHLQAYGVARGDDELAALCMHAWMYSTTNEQTGCTVVRREGVRAGWL